MSFTKHDLLSMPSNGMIRNERRRRVPRSSMLDSLPIPAPSSDFSSQPRVLLVEDNSTNLLLARRVLEKAGYWVEVAVNGREGVEAARHQRFDVILMDVQMPVLDGCA